MSDKAATDTARTLSDDEIIKLGGPGTVVMRYPDLKNYRTWNEFMNASPSRKVAVLFLVNSPTSGHWLAAFEDKDAVPSVFDPMGTALDAQRRKLPPEQRAALGESAAEFTRLLNGKEVEVNRTKFQAMANDIQTCGRWSGVRLKYAALTDDEFDDWVCASAKRDGYTNLDEWITAVTAPELSGGGYGDDFWLY